jgi:hypothetical protein
MAAKLYDVAVLFASYHRVAFDAERLRIALVEPLRADPIVLLTYRRNDEDCAWPAHARCLTECACRIAQRLHGLQPIARLAVEAQNSTDELASMLETSPAWPRLFGAYQKTGACVLVNGSRSKYSCRTSKMRFGGNSFLAPVLGNAHLNVLRQLYMQSRVLALLEAHEASEARGGRRYMAVVWSRLEYHWLRPHPPLALFAPSADAERGLGSALDCVWVPLEEDYAGTNDRHALMPRAVAPTYLGRWRALMDGSVLQILACWGPCAESSEKLLAAARTAHALSTAIKHSSHCGGYSVYGAGSSGQRCATTTRASAATRHMRTWDAASRRRGCPATRVGALARST